MWTRHMRGALPQSPEPPDPPGTPLTPRALEGMAWAPSPLHPWAEIRPLLSQTVGPRTGSRGGG